MVHEFVYGVYTGYIWNYLAIDRAIVISALRIANFNEQATNFTFCAVAALLTDEWLGMSRFLKTIPL